jgi:Na+-translocating ferredoxin:NAD+ oxidoreductase RnfE subunit
MIKKCYFIASLLLLIIGKAIFIVFSFIDFYSFDLWYKLLRLFIVIIDINFIVLVYYRGKHTKSERETSR